MDKRELEPNSLVIYNGKIVLENRVVEGAIIVRHGIIMDIIINSPDTEQWHKYRHEYVLVDAKGRFILPGFIDIHCDAIEKEIQPRPNTLLSIPFAFQQYEAKLPAYGITTMLHSLSLGVGLSIRGEHLVSDTINYIEQFNQSSVSARNLIHLRYELSYFAGRPLLEELITENRIHLLSFMDHAPGIGQYHKEGSFARYVMKNQGVTLEEVQPIIDELEERRAKISEEDVAALAKLASSHHIALASHDDDRREKIEQNVELGIGISEFPITEEVALYAQNKGLQLCLGAPNVVRGGSHDGNLSATAIIEAGKRQVLSSDYLPSTLLEAVFILADSGKISLAEAVKLVTLNAAHAVGLANKLGSIRIGKAADLLLVDKHNGHPYVAMTILNGDIVFSKNHTSLVNAE